MQSGVAGGRGGFRVAVEAKSVPWFDNAESLRSAGLGLRPCSSRPALVRPARASRGGKQDHSWARYPRQFVIPGLPGKLVGLLRLASVPMTLARLELLRHGARENLYFFLFLFCAWCLLYTIGKKWKSKKCRELAMCVFKSFNQFLCNTKATDVHVLLLLKPWRSLCRLSH